MDATPQLIAVARDVVDQNVTAAYSHANPYNAYVPSKEIGLAMTIVFAVFSVLHLVQMLIARPKVWWLLPVVAGGLLEVLGWAARLGSAHDVPNGHFFLLQLVALAVAPSFFSSIMFAVQSKIVAAKGAEFSRIAPRRYAQVFVTLDVFALLVIVAGGALSALEYKDNQPWKLGGQVMMGGFVIQTVVFVLFAIFSLEFYIRLASNKAVGTRELAPSPRLHRFITSDSEKTMVDDESEPKTRIKINFLGWTLLLVYVFLFVRAVFRIAELAEPWSGYIVDHEIFFVVFDAVPMISLLVVWALVHPAPLLNACTNASAKRESQRFQNGFMGRRGGGGLRAFRTKLDPFPEAPRNSEDTIAASLRPSKGKEADREKEAWKAHSRGPSDAGSYKYI